MRVLVVYDSQHGNTEALAKAIGAALAGDVTVVRARDADVAALEGLDLLVVGSPTHSGRPTPSVQAFLDRAPDLRGVRAAAFDTRMSTRTAEFMGHAASRLARGLQDRGAELVGNPGGFLVEGPEGPLRKGEVERAVAWARDVVDKAK